MTCNDISGTMNTFEQFRSIVAHDIIRTPWAWDNGLFAYQNNRMESLI